MDCIAYVPLYFCVLGVDEGFDVAKGECQGLELVGVIGVSRYVIGHYHAAVADFIEGFDHLVHVDVTFIGIDFLETVAAALDVSQVHVKYFATRSEIADHVEDFSRRVFEIARYGPYA